MDRIRLNMRLIWSFVGIMGLCTSVGAAIGCTICSTSIYKNEFKISNK